MPSPPEQGTEAVLALRMVKAACNDSYVGSSPGACVGRMVACGNMPTVASVTDIRNVGEEGVVVVRLSSRRLKKV
jgi:hypothetical protein